MRFSPEGYYVERYVKCETCGLLIYEPGLTAPGRSGLFCSQWCIEWDRLRQAGEQHPVLPLTGTGPLSPAGSQIDGES